MKTKILKPILAGILTIAIAVNPYSTNAALTPAQGLDGAVYTLDDETADAEAEPEDAAAGADAEQGEASGEEPAAAREDNEEYATPGITAPQFAMPLAAPAGTTPMTGAEMNARFTYTGSYEGYWYNEGGTQKWFVMLLTDGTFTPKEALKADIFLVGGGGGGQGLTNSGGTTYAGGAGGGGGYTNTILGATYTADQAVSVSIGAGGSRGLMAAGAEVYGTDGGTTYFGSYSVAGGTRSLLGDGGSGGAGGSGVGENTVPSGAHGGSNGSDGGYTGGNYFAGTGQGTNTYAFKGDKAPFNAMLFAGGGGAGNRYTAGSGGAGGGGAGGTGSGSNGSDGSANTGGGGGGGCAPALGGYGGSGIVIVRNVNSPPTSVGTITVPASVNMWATSNAVSASWVAATDPDGDAITYTVEYAINGSGTYTVAGTTSSTSYTLNLSAIQPGTVKFRITPVDSFGNTGPSREAASWTTCVYNTPPTTPTNMQNPAAVNSWQTTAITFSWTASTDVNTGAGQTITYYVEESVNGGAWTSVQTSTATSFTHNISIPSHTSVQLRVRAYDGYDYSAGYLTSSTVGITHNTPPTTPTNMQNPAAINSWQNTAVTFTWSASTDVNGQSITYYVEKSVNGGSWTSVQSGTATTYTHHAGIPSDTSVQLRVRAYDGYDYSTAYLTSGAVVITHDITAPLIQVVATPDATTAWVKDEVTITVIVSDAVSGLKTLTVPAGVTPAGNRTISGLSETLTFKTSANSTFTFTVTDNAGNSASQSVSTSKIDTDDPVMAYTAAPPSGEFTNGNVTITLDMSDNSSGLSSFMSLNGQESVSGLAAQKVFTATANGVYPFSVTDMVGHNTAINAVIDMIDRIKPVAAIVPRVNRWTNAASVTLDISGTDDYSGVAGLTLPDSSYVTGAAAAYEICGNGEYTASATDRATNASNPAVLNYGWFDRTRPTVMFVKFVDADNPLMGFLADLGLITNRHVKLSVTGDDTPEDGEGESGVVQFFYRVLDRDNEVVTDWTGSPIGAEPVMDYDVNGYVELYVVDAAGSISDTGTYNIIIDTKNPEYEVIYSTTETTNDSVDVTLRILPGGSGAKGWILPEGGILVPGAEITYTFTENAIKTFVACNNAGNRTEVEIKISNIEALKVPVELWENNKPVIYAILHATGRREIEDVTYPDLYGIRYIDLSANNMISIPDVFGECKNLEHLDLRGNLFETVPDCVGRLMNMRYLDLSNNNLAGIPEWITGLHKLTMLDVSLNYLVDYDCPLILSDYRDAGNFTQICRPDMYSFAILDPAAQKEYVGNTAMFKVVWSYGGEEVASLEAHRKALFSSLYPLYRSYRPLVYRYEAENGQIKAVTADYAQVYFPESGTAAIALELGAA